MDTVTQNKIKYDHTFDRKTKRPQLNDIQTVFHCHHYASLFTQLALDAGEAEMLKECARETFRKVLDTYFASNPDVNTIRAKVEIGCQYYALMGLGKMVVKFLGDDSGEIEILSSHIDKGWMKKWGHFDKPTNYITAGYIEALFESVLNLTPKSFEAVETQSIVIGAESSYFKVTKRR